MAAGKSAQAIGVESYVVDGHGADLYKAGERVGRLEVAGVASDLRSILVSLDDGRAYFADVELGTEGSARIPLTDDHPMHAFQTDPALATLFASFDLSFPLATTAPTSAVAPEGYTICSPPNATVACRMYSCNISNHTVSNLSRIDTNGAACPAGTKVIPSDAPGPVCPAGTSGPAGCYCGVESWVSTVESSCPPITGHVCLGQGQCDRFLRVRTCTDPGSQCNQAGSGQTNTGTLASDCTTQPPLAPATCAASGTAYTLSVSKTANANGTVISTDGYINCGSTCSANVLANTAVTLTRTDAYFDWAGFTGAGCSGTGTSCTVTVDASKSVSANYGIALGNISGVNQPTGGTLRSLDGIMKNSSGSFYVSGDFSAYTVTHNGICNSGWTATSGTIVCARNTTGSGSIRFLHNATGTYRDITVSFYF